MRHRTIFTVAIWSALLLVANAHEGLAQRRPNAQFLPYSEVGFGAGTSTYFGDLAGYRQAYKALFTLPRWNASLMYTRHFTPNFAARVGFTWARITGDDYTFNNGNIAQNGVFFTRNLHFRNDLKEFAITGIYQFTPDGHSANHRAPLTTYIFGGVALVAHSPEARLPVSERADSSRRWVKLQPLGTEGQGQPGYAKPYSLVTVAIPVGIGIRYALNESFNLAAEIGYRYTFSDYLDDVGGPYANPNDLQGLAKIFGNRTGETIAARANVDRTAGIQQAQAAGIDPAQTGRGGASVKLPLKDSYLLTSFQIHYIIPGKIRCPPVRTR